jgi:hypothetical protein
MEPCACGSNQLRIDIATDQDVWLDLAGLGWVSMPFICVHCSRRVRVRFRVENMVWASNVPLVGRITA